MPLLDVHLGRPLVRGSLTVFPVWNGQAVSRRGYDVGSSAVTVSERAGSPVVGELVVGNSCRRPALVLEGELLEGGQQHRVAARSVLLAPGASMVLAVHCVEEGRWSGAGTHVRRGRRAPATVRAAQDQGRVWHSVRRHEQRYGENATHSLLDTTSNAAKEAARLVHGLHPLPFQSGVLIGIAGQPALLEVYDSPATLASVWDALLHAAALDALGAPPCPTPGRRARRFVDRLAHVPLAVENAGLGTIRTGRSPYARVSTLCWGDRPVHAVAVNLRHELVAA
jgi:hypothetical protein